MENFGVISQKKWKGHFVTWCNFPEEMKQSLRDGCHPRRNETVALWRGVTSQRKWRSETATSWRGVMSQKKWNGHSVTGCHPRRNETVTLWRGVISQRKWNCHSVTRCNVPEEMKLPLSDAVSCPRRNETVTPWRGVIPEEMKPPPCDTVLCPKRNETATSWRSVMSRKKWNCHSVTRCHVPEEMKW